jgi:dolichol-phosphate mannosyltransferase
MGKKFGIHTDSISVIVPTYREVENIPLLVSRLSQVRDTAHLDLELLLMDDDSQDGSEALVASMALPWIRLVKRTSNRGLSSAVLDGLKLSTREICVVMDADLSHPPEKIPEMLTAIETGVDIVVGSRFTEGGSTSDDWGPFRWLNSRIATVLAMPLTTMSDPMSGFFALRRSTFNSGKDFDPVGYKILLEILVKCRCRFSTEVPIHFDNRRFGRSKLSLREQINYIRHLRRLYVYKYGNWSHLAQFLLVGFSGLIVNLLILTLLLRERVPQRPAIAAAIVVSMLWNFVLNRRFSFSYARHQPVLRQLLGFMAACAFGAVVNYCTTIAVWQALRYKQLAALLGVVAGTFFNFGASRFLVFRMKHVRPP